MSDSDKLLEKLWVEKYRPKTLDDVVLEDDQRGFLQKCLTDGEIPHLLFIGPPGSGKTTVSRIICDTIIKDEMDIIQINGSDETGIGTVRDSIKGFLQSPSYESKHKIIFIDEFDYMTLNAQASLRSMMEEYRSVGRFVCTGNYKTKIITPLHSRFQIFEMKTLPEKFVLDFCCKILDKESIEYQKENAELVVQNLIPDVRKIINTLQKHVVDGKLTGIDKNSITSIEKKITANICLICDSIISNKNDSDINSRITDIHNILAEGNPDFLSVYIDLFNNDKIPPWAKICVNKYSNVHNTCAIPQMNFIAMILEIIKNGKQYYLTFGRN